MFGETFHTTSSVWQSVLVSSFFVHSLSIQSYVMEVMWWHIESPASVTQSVILPVFKHYDAIYGIAITIQSTKALGSCRHMHTYDAAVFFITSVVVFSERNTRANSVFCLHHWHNAGNHFIALDSDGPPVTRQRPTHKIEVEWLLVTQSAKCRPQGYDLTHKKSTI